jgi:hypothetical protein
MALIQCKECSKDISDQAQTCPHCGAPTNKKTMDSVAQKKSLQKTSIIVTLIICVPIAFVVVCTNIVSLNSSYSSSDSGTESTSSYQSSSVSTGGIVKLPYGFLGTTKDNYKRIIELSVAKDRDGIEQMISAGQALVVAEDTPAKVIQNGILNIEVRILDGKYAGQSGWISSELVKR